MALLLLYIKEYPKTISYFQSLFCPTGADVLHFNTKKQKNHRKSRGVETIVKDIKRKIGRCYNTSEEKIRIVLQGLRREDSIASLCRTKHVL